MFHVIRTIAVGGAFWLPAPSLLATPPAPAPRFAANVAYKLHLAPDNGLRTSEVEFQLRVAMNVARGCLQPVLESGPARRGILDLRIRIAADGQLAEILFGPSPSFLVPAHDCLRRWLAGRPWPRGRDGKETSAQLALSYWTTVAPRCTLKGVGGCGLD
jgi:hypothetical protein